MFAKKQGELSQDDLLRYLSDNLDDENTHVIEEYLTDDDFAADALEGLQQMENSATIQQTVYQLNKELEKKLGSSRTKRKLKEIPSLQWVIYAIVAILFLSILAFVVIHLARS